MTSVRESEIVLFKAIKDNCKVIFDIGCREDDTYSEISNKDTLIYLFEPNIKFFNQVLEKVKDNSNIKLYNYGLGDVTDNVTYYNNTQSIIDRKIHNISNYNDTINISIIKFMDFVLDNGVTNIDFIKIDTEGCEPNILYNGYDFIKSNVNCLQVEYSSTIIDNVKYSHVDIKTLIKDFGDIFKFYFLFDGNHPICKTYTDMINPINDDNIDLMEYWMKIGCGFDLVMKRIKK